MKISLINTIRKGPLGWIALLVFLMNTAVLKGERIVYTLNDGWYFRKGELPVGSLDNPATEKTLVNIPHTWNNLDGDDETPGFYRGKVWYWRTIPIDASLSGKEVYLRFEGANQECEVFVNGTPVGKHIGGYTRFSFNITPYLEFGKANKIAIQLDNAYNAAIPPLSADFTFYGGIYRDVFLEALNPIHLSMEDLASSGVYLSTPVVTPEYAEVAIKALVSNRSDKRRKVWVENSILDENSRVVKKTTRQITLLPGQTNTIREQNIRIQSPRLWDIDSPYLYTVVTRIYDKNNTFDEVTNPLGLRWFEFSPEKGFILNGKPRKLIGTNRHQDYFKKGNALRDEMHVRDILLLKKMGGNFLRVSHYPQDPVVLDLCDKLGIVTSVEIPVINAVTPSADFLNNSVHMAREMVRQDFNHPSVMIWGYMNEILLRPPYKGDAEKAVYYEWVEKIARALENAVREEDPSRYTMMAYHNNHPAYKEANLTEIPMIQGWNLYQGWYEPDINEFERLLENIHASHPDKVLLVTEYGPGVDPRLHSFSSERFDFTQEYGLVYHQHYLKEIRKRPFVAGSNMWNLNDFYSESRVDAVPHVNNKGVVGLDREIKDTYLFYQCALAKEPMVKVGNQKWMARSGAADSVRTTVCFQPVPVFSNCETVELQVNGISLGRKSVTDGIAYFSVPFAHGENILKAYGYQDKSTVNDRLSVNFNLIPHQVKSDQFTELNVSLGSHCYFEDRTADICWIPEQSYRPGSWGYIGGEAYRRKTAFGSLLGANQDILGTDQNPIFQTQRRGIEAFKADVADGNYSVYLYWAELESDRKKEALVYNLGADIDADNSLQGAPRIFSVLVNGKPVLKNINLTQQYGVERAVIQKINVNVKDGKGITLQFDSISGQPVLNAIRIYKNYGAGNARIAEKNKNLDLFLCIGQSNMAGRGKLTPAFQDTLNGVFLFTDQAVFESAANPLNRYSTIRKALPMQGVGPAYGFGKLLQQQTGREVGLVVNAKGGTAIEQWQKGAPDGFYQQALERLQAALSYGTLKGIIWHQGEANLASPEKYRSQIKQLIADLRSDLNAPELPVIIGEVASWNWSGKPGREADFNKMLQSLVREIPALQCVEAKDLKPLKDESDPHFSAESQIVLGERYARKAKDLCY